MIAVETPVVKVPIRMDETGTIRVSGTRVTLEVFLATYNHGYTAEALHDAYYANVRLKIETKCEKMRRMSHY